MLDSKCTLLAQNYFGLCGGKLEGPFTCTLSSHGCPLLSLMRKLRGAGRLLAALLICSCNIHLFLKLGNRMFQEESSGHAGKIGQVSLVVGNPYGGDNQERVTARFY